MTGLVLFQSLSLSIPDDVNYIYDVWTNRWIFFLYVGLDCLMEVLPTGVEYIVSDRIFEDLPPEEQKLWHSHAYEVDVHNL